MKITSIRDRLLTSTMVGGAALLALTAVPAATLLTPTAAFAQAATQGALSGTVTDTSGASVGSANVTVTSTTQGFSRSFTTGADGAFRAVALPPGSYTIAISANGFDAFSDTVNVPVGSTATYDFTIGRTGAASNVDDVVVVGTRAAISEFDATTTGLTVDVERLASVTPIARSSNALALLAPGVTASDSAFGNLPTISGSSAGENTYYVNGLNTTDFVSFLGGASVPFEFYQTFETKTGGYSAEFGRGTGGVINATTKSGGNEWEFGITAYWEPEQLRNYAPNTYLQINEEDYRESSDIILEAGGPIIQDRLFVYGLYNWRNRELFDRNTSALSYRTTEDSPVYGAKVDFIVADGHRIEATYFSDATETETEQMTYFSGNAGSRNDGIYNSESGGDNYIVRYNGIWTDWLTTSIAYGVTENHGAVFSNEDGNPVITDITGYDYNGDGILDVPNALTAQLGNWLVGTPTFNDDRREMLRADLDLYFSAFGEHHLRIGLDNENLEASQRTSRSGSGFDICRPDGPINNATNEDALDCSGDRTGGVAYRYQNPLSTARSFSNADGTGVLDPILLTGDHAGEVNPAYNPTLVGRADLIGSFAPSRARVEVYDNSGSWESIQSAIYIQDSWEVSDRLTLNLGVRSESFENKNIKGETFINMENQIAPRLGFTYDVFGDRQAKLTGFYGRYHLPVAANTNQRLAGRELYFRDTYKLDFSGGANDANRDGINDTTGLPIFYEVYGQETLSDGTTKPTNTQVNADIEPMYVDEMILGYSQRFGGYTASVTAMYRDLKTAIDDVAIDAAVLAYCEDEGIDGCSGVWTGFHQYVLTNPGSDMTVALSSADLTTAADIADDGVLNNSAATVGERIVNLSSQDLGYPDPKRTYKALEFALERHFDGVWGGRLSYVWSDAEGNYEGALKSDNGQTDPGLTQDYDQPGLTDGSAGKLPNNRPHTFKAYGNWQVTPNFNIGGNLIIQSPREFGCIGIHPTDAFAAVYGASSWFCDTNGDGVSEPTPRGSVFESHWLKQIDLTFSYTLRDMWGIPGEGVTLRADIFNIFNQQAALDYQEVGELSDRGGRRGPGSVNPYYRQVTGYQAPRYVRLGASIKF